MTGTPLAYGFFNSVGVLQVGSSNISCTFAGLEYIISITGQAYVVSQFVTNVTAAGGFAVPHCQPQATTWLSRSSMRPAYQSQLPTGFR
jgi:hypothetical protein